MQKTGMPANFAEMQLPANVSVVLHPVGRAATPNWTVESVNVPAQLADPKDPRKSRVQAVIAGYGTPAASKTVSLVVNGKTIATRKVDIPRTAGQRLSFSRSMCLTDSTIARSRSTRPTVSQPTTQRVCRQKIRPGTGIVRAPGERYSLTGLLWRGPGRGRPGAFNLQPIDSEKSADIDPSKYAFVVLSDATALPSIFENALLRYVRDGGSVLIATGTSAAHHARIPIYGGYTSDAHSYSRDGFATVGQTDLTHAVMNDSGWDDLKFYYVAGVDPAQARVIVRLTDSTPLLMEKQIGEGHVLLFASGFDNLTNNLPIRPAFVPFVDRTARYLSGSDNAGGSRLVDSYVPLRTATAGNPSTGVEILDPDGHRALSLREAATAQSFQLTRAGFYQIRFANGKSALIGVNPDRRESNLEPIRQRSPETLGHALHNARIHCGCGYRAGKK